MARGIAEIPADAADQDVVLAGAHRAASGSSLRAVVDELDARRLAQDVAHLVRGDRPSDSNVIASLWARSTGTRTQVTPTRDLPSSKILRVSCDDLGLFLVVAGRRDRSRCCG